MSEQTQNKILLKRGQSAPGTILETAEPGYDLKNKRLYIGNGVGNAPTAIPNEAYISSEIAKAQLSGTADLSAYATKEYVNNSIKDVDVDLTGYATEEYVEEALKDISVEDVVYADDNGENDALAPINASTLGGVPADEYATQRFVEDKIIEAKLDTEETDIDFTDFVRKEDLKKLNFPVDSVNGKTGAVELNINDIGAAPAGYGLGVGSAWISADVDIDTLMLPGWYSYGQDNISSNKPFTIADIFVLARGSGATCIQIATYRAGTYPYIKIRKMGSNAWSDWAYINPPMELGVEYRTIELYNEEPVYIKRLDIGALPNASRAVLGNLSFPKRKALISVTGVATHVDGQVIPFPYKASTTQYGDVDLVAYTMGTQSITGYITTTVDMSKYTGVLTFKYTKSES